MVLTLDDFEGSNQSNEVRIVHQNDKLDDWMLPLISAFESTTQACLPYAERHQAAIKKGIKLFHFTLYKEGTPLSSITLSLSNQIARIDDVSTVVE